MYHQRSIHDLEQLRNNLDIESNFIILLWVFISQGFYFTYLKIPPLRNIWKIFTSKYLSHLGFTLTKLIEKSMDEIDNPIIMYMTSEGLQ